MSTVIIEEQFTIKACSISSSHIFPLHIACFHAESLSTVIYLITQSFG